jgi:hypothetical protein
MYSKKETMLAGHVIWGASFQTFTETVMETRHVGFVVGGTVYNTLSNRVNESGAGNVTSGTMKCMSVL